MIKKYKYRLNYKEKDNLVNINNDNEEFKRCK